MFNRFFFDVDQIYHLACPASPVAYQSDPLRTLHTNYIGTLNVLNVAKQNNCKILFTSTSEIYGDPLVHPQTEEYRGNVNTMGPRACYDEGKRVAETLVYEYHKQHKVSICVARIFNTYGPRMSIDDGRVVTNFIQQILTEKDITIYGDGTQTRSFCYVSDTVRGLVALMNADGIIGPVNIGNPLEMTVYQLATLLIDKTKSMSKIAYKPLPQDDPIKRRPDISKARELLNWNPTVGIDEGIEATIQNIIQQSTERMF